jgi:hypothetical protein
MGLNDGSLLKLGGNLLEMPGQQVHSLLSYFR